VSNARKIAPGLSFVLFGIGLCVVGAIAWGIYAAGASAVPRTETLMIVGLPLGALAIIIGVVRMVRERRN
jgi:drug/metabolite transporter (DMT)-like permease